MNFGVKVKPKTVSQSRYDQMIQEELFKTNVALQKTFGCDTPLLTLHEIKFSRYRICHRARARVFSKLREMGYSYPSIARASGYHHASVINGVEIAAKEKSRVTSVCHYRKRATVKTTSGESVSPTELASFTPHLDESPVQIGMAGIA